MVQGGVDNPGSDDGTVPPLNPIDETLISADPQVYAYNLDLFIEHGSTPEGDNPQQTMPAWGDEGKLHAAADRRCDRLCDEPQSCTGSDCYTGSGVVLATSLDDQLKRRVSVKLYECLGHHDPPSNNYPVHRYPSGSSRNNGANRLPSSTGAEFGESRNRRE